MSQKNLVVMTSTFPRWHEDTTPSFVFDLAVRLTKDYHVIVLAPHAKGAKRYEIMSGIEVIRYRYFFDWGEVLAYNNGILGNLKKNPLTYLAIPLMLISQIISLITLLRSKNIDVIHAHWSIPNGICAAISLSLLTVKTKLVCTLHGSDLRLSNRFFVWLHQRVFKKSCAITTVSQYLFESAVAMGAASFKLSVMPMGVDTQNKFKPNNNIGNRDKLLFVGRLIKNKGVDILLKAMAIVVATRSDQQLVIVGEGLELNSLKKMTNDLNISNNVTFLGSKSHEVLPEFYQQALIFISPTLDEGFGLTIAEAMACECAVIASNIGAVNELITDQKTGLLFEVGNHEALAACILRLLTDSGFCETLMRNGREKVINNFGWEQSAARYKKLFDKLLKC